MVSNLLLFNLSSTITSIYSATIQKILFILFVEALLYLFRYYLKYILKLDVSNLPHDLISIYYYLKNAFKLFVSFPTIQNHQH